MIGSGRCVHSSSVMKERGGEVIAHLTSALGGSYRWDGWLMRAGCSVSGGIALGGIMAGLRLCSGRWGRGRRGRGRGGGPLLAVVIVIVGPPALPCSLGSALPPQVIRGQGLLQHRAVLPPVVQAELPQSLQQMSRRAATSLLTLLLSPRIGLRWHARGQTLQARSMVKHTQTHTSTRYSHHCHTNIYHTLAWRCQRHPCTSPTGPCKHYLWPCDQQPFVIFAVWCNREGGREGGEGVGQHPHSPEKRACKSRLIRFINMTNTLTCPSCTDLHHHIHPSRLISSLE